MNFILPYRLLILLAVVALAGAYVWSQRRRHRYALRFTNTDLLASVMPRSPGWRRHVGAAFLLIALTTLVVGFARPTRNVKVPRERAVVILAIDVSLSMDATDVLPSRLKAAQDAALRFIDVFPKRFQLGLVTFAGAATVNVAPTRRRDPVRRAIDRIDLGPQTAIGEGVFASLDAIKDAASNRAGKTPTKTVEKLPARIVLLSDGSTNSGRPNDDAAAAALKLGVPVSTIAFGTPGGSVKVGGQAVTVPVDRDALQKLAQTTNGTFATAATAERLRKIYVDLASSVGYETRHREITIWFLGAGLVLVFTAATASLLWMSRLP